MRIRIVSCCALVLALVIALDSSAAFAQTSRAPAKMLVGYPPGARSTFSAACLRRR